MLLTFNDFVTYQELLCHLHTFFTFRVYIKTQPNILTRDIK